MKQGAYEWLWVRIWGVCMIPVGLWLMYFILPMELMDAHTLVQTVTQPVQGCLLILSAVVFGFHSYMGMHEIIMDYVHHPLLHKFCCWFVRLGLVIIVGGLSAFVMRGMLS